MSKTARKPAKKSKLKARPLRERRQDGHAAQSNEVTVVQTYAKDIMSTKILCVGQNTTVEEALKILVNSGITGVPVVDTSGKMIGVFSDYDVIMQLNKQAKPEAVAFREPITFTRQVEAVSEETPLPEILDLFVKSRFRRLPVINKTGKLIGIITRRDLMKLFFYQAALT